MGQGGTPLPGSLKKPSKYGSRPSENSAYMLRLGSGRSLILFGRIPESSVTLILLTITPLLFVVLLVMSYTCLSNSSGCLTNMIPGSHLPMTIGALLTPKLAQPHFSGNSLTLMIPCRWPGAAATT